MSYQPSRWAIGLVPLAVLWVLGSTGAQHDIEGRLSSKVGAAIRDDVNAAYVKARGRDVSLRGDAFTHASLKRAIEKANDAEGVRHVDSGRLGVITAVAPYVWRIERNDGRVKMSGDVPNPQAKAEIAAAAKSLGEVTDGADLRARRVAGSDGRRRLRREGVGQFHPRLRRLHRRRPGRERRRLRRRRLRAGAGVAECAAQGRQADPGRRDAAFGVALCILRRQGRRRRDARRGSDLGAAESRAGQTRRQAVPRREDRQQAGDRKRRAERRTGGGGVGAGRAGQARHRQGRIARFRDHAHRQGGSAGRHRGCGGARGEGASRVQDRHGSDRPPDGERLCFRRRARRGGPAPDRLHAGRGGAPGAGIGGQGDGAGGGRPDADRRRAARGDGFRRAGQIRARPAYRTGAGRGQPCRRQGQHKGEHARLAGRA